MNFIQAIILGIVEGVTEYLPISSTFHLIWVGKLLGIPQTDFQKLFEVVIQSGAIVAVLVLYIKEFVNNWKLMQKLVVSFIPTALVGFFMYKIIKNVFFESLWLQLGVFAIVGIFFIVFEKTRKNERLGKGISEISYKEAAIVGLAQSLAIIPGVSRAGAVLISMMFLGVKREEGAKYSFLLAVPTLFAASALDLFKSRSLVVGQMNNIGLLTVGFGVSFICALVVVKWFVNYLQKHDLSVFGWYRVMVVVLIFILLRF